MEVSGSVTLMTARQATACYHRPASPDGITPQITSLGKDPNSNFKSTVSIEHTLLLHHHKVKKS